MNLVYNSLAYIGNVAWGCGKKAAIAVKQNPLKAVAIVAGGIFAGIAYTDSTWKLGETFDYTVCNSMQPKLNEIFDCALYNGFQAFGIEDHRLNDAFEDIYWENYGLGMNSYNTEKMDFRCKADLEYAFDKCYHYFPEFEDSLYWDFYRDFKPLYNKDGLAFTSLDNDDRAKIFTVINKYKLSGDPISRSYALRAERLCEQGKEIEDKAEELYWAEELLGSGSDCIKHALPRHPIEAPSYYPYFPSRRLYEEESLDSGSGCIENDPRNEYSEVYFRHDTRDTSPNIHLSAFLLYQSIFMSDQKIKMAYPDLQKAYDACFYSLPNEEKNEVNYIINKYKEWKHPILNRIALKIEKMCKHWQMVAVLQKAYDDCFHYDPDRGAWSHNADIINQYKRSRDPILKKSALEAKKICGQTQLLDNLNLVFDTIGNKVYESFDRPIIESFNKLYPELSQSPSPAIKDYARRAYDRIHRNTIKNPDNTINKEVAIIITGIVSNILLASLCVFCSTGQFNFAKN